ncbi:MAG: hypothetical protein H8K04_09355 [Nitrospira sp.]
MKRVYSKQRVTHQPILRLFSALAKRIEDYDNPPNDTGYWYGERAMTGFLSAAAWSLKSGWTVEEFTGLRMSAGRRGNGKGDIWLGFGRKAYTIEAKAVWPGSSIENAIRGAERKLSEAKTQLRQPHKTYQVGVPVAICYIIPDLNMKGRFSGKHSIKEFFTEMPERLSDHQTAVASLWYDKRAPRYQGRIYPGVVIVGRLLSIWSGRIQAPR